MANRIVLNETSYHGAGAIENIATEAKSSTCSIKRGLSTSFTPTSNPIPL